MNILHVVTYFAPCFSAGGVVNAAYQIARKQVENGHNVTVYTTDSCQERIKLENNYNVDVDGIKVFYFNKTLIYDLTIKRNQGSETQNKGQSGKHSGMTIARTSKKEVLLMKLLKRISHLMEEYYKIFSK